ncbi:caspase-8-like isoform X2 [Brienomyrus brachyistius]|uniref:caspase-8-like isoform X2 n=1 Tax=Brienomyrus brachyistius TaxID=42636 RepID=UPI0020B3B466|nr:caspase-8-like isoform X2 [Brienomyrus brachyistius]
MINSLFYVLTNFMPGSRYHNLSKPPRLVQYHTCNSNYRKSMDINVLLHNISEELDSNEIDALKFLCKDHIQRKKMQDIHDARDLFLRLEEQGLLEDVSIVGELLYTIKRYDLLKVLGTTQKKTQDRLQMQVDCGCLISSYRKLLYELSEDVSEDSLEAIKFLLKIPQVRSCKSFLDVLVEMEKQELLADDNLENLESLLNNCQPELCFRVKEYAARKDVDNTSRTSVTESMIVPSVQESPSSTMSPISGEGETTLFTDTGPNGEYLGEVNLPRYDGNHKDLYNMTRRPRGYCIIINNYHFEKASQLGNRKGTNKDADNLSSVFSWLHFEVHQYKDLTARDMLNTVKDFGKRDHSSRDAFVCCVLSHGEKGSVFGTDGETIFIQEITQPFKSSNCPSLAGKPKMFFFQACQGKGKQQGLSIQADGDGDGDRNYSREIPDDSDFLLGMATVEDYQSFRHVHLGSIYIQELCKQLRHGCPRNKSILEILTIVNREVSLQSFQDCKQMPEPRYTLTKTLVLPVD